MICVSWTTSTFAQISSKLPSIPNPKGLIEASSLSPLLTKMANANITSSQRLLGSYHSLEAVAEIQQTGELPSEAFARAVIQKRHASVESAKGGIAERIGAIKREANHLFDIKAPDVARVIKRYEDSAANIVEGVEVKMEGTSMLGVVQENEDLIQISLLATCVVNKPGLKTRFFMTTAAAILRVGNDIIEVNVISPFENRDSVIRANETLKKWIADIVSANR
jgi:hypothetical protein